MIVLARSTPALSEHLFNRLDKMWSGKEYSHIVVVVVQSFVVQQDHKNSAGVRWEEMQKVPERSYEVIVGGGM